MAEQQAKSTDGLAPKERTSSFSKMRNAYKRTKRGLIAGALLGGLAAGYEDNVSHAYKSSLAAHEQSAEYVRKERDRRTTWQKIKGEQSPAPIPVGKEWKTKRDKAGNLVSIGKSDVLLASNKYMNWTPNLAVGPKGFKRIGQGAIGGGVTGLAWPLLPGAARGIGRGARGLRTLATKAKEKLRRRRMA